MEDNATDLISQSSTGSVCLVCVRFLPPPLSSLPTRCRRRATIELLIFFLLNIQLISVIYVNLNCAFCKCVIINLKYIKFAHRNKHVNVKSWTSFFSERKNFSGSRETYVKGVHRNFSTVRYLPTGPAAPGYASRSNNQPSAHTNRVLYVRRQVYIVSTRLFRTRLLLERDKSRERARVPLTRVYISPLRSIFNTPRTERVPFLRKRRKGIYTIPIGRSSHVTSLATCGSCGQDCARDRSRTARPIDISTSATTWRKGNAHDDRSW